MRDHLQKLILHIDSILEDESGKLKKQSLKVKEMKGLLKALKKLKKDLYGT